MRLLFTTDLIPGILIHERALVRATCMPPPSEQVAACLLHQSMSLPASSVNTALTRAPALLCILPMLTYPTLFSQVCMNRSSDAEQSCPSDNGNQWQMLSSGPNSCDDFCQRQDQQQRPDLCLASTHCAYCPPPAAPLAFHYPARYPLRDSPSTGCRPLNISSIAPGSAGIVMTSDYSAASNYVYQRGLVAIACGWQAQSGNISKSTSQQVVFTPAIRGNGWGTPVPGTSRCASLSPAQCAFSSACILCGNSSNPGVGLVCAPYQPNYYNNIADACSANYGRETGFRGGILHDGGGPYGFDGYNTIMGIYPGFCSALMSLPTPGIACTFAMGVCGWCVDRATCVPSASPGSWSSPLFAENCSSMVNSQQNFYGSGQYSPSYAFQQVPANTTCAVITNMTQCLASPFCGWCPVPPYSPGYGLSLQCLPFQPGNTNQFSADQPAYGSCTAGFTPGGPGAVVKTVTCGDLSSSNGCSTCLNATAIYGKTIADGPCGFCPTFGACAAGNASGPFPRAETPGYQAITGSCVYAPESWRYGAATVDAQCAVDGCAQLTSCESCAGTSSPLNCRWCLGSNSCVNSMGTCPAGGSLSGLTNDPFSEPWSGQSLTMCPGFCAKRNDCASCQVRRVLAVTVTHASCHAFRFGRLPKACLL